MEVASPEQSTESPQNLRGWCAEPQGTILQVCALNVPGPRPFSAACSHKQMDGFRILLCPNLGARSLTPLFLSSSTNHLLSSKHQASRTQQGGRLSCAMLSVMSHSQVGTTGRRQMARKGKRDLGSVRSIEYHEDSLADDWRQWVAWCGLGVVLGEEVGHPDPPCSGLGSRTPRLGVTCSPGFQMATLAERQSSALDLLCILLGSPWVPLPSPPLFPHVNSPEAADFPH